jgi:AcrR family transcriptional regulator
MKTNDNSIEQNIIEVAREAFIEKGFAETSMSDIAARAGMNRPKLHYYFRTKDRLFEAVFSDLLTPFIPQVHEILEKKCTFEQRVGEIVDIYVSILRVNQKLPLFIIREVQRDAMHMVDTISKLQMGEYAAKIKIALETEMERGEIKKVPIEFVIYTFYGLIFTPIISRPLTALIFPETDADFEQHLEEWKSYVVSQMCALLSLD